MPGIRQKSFFNVILQSIIRLLTRIFYRIDIIGKLDVPKGKGVVFIANHTSFVDFLMIAHVAPLFRAVFSVMDYGIYRKPIVNFICRNTACIPIVSKKVSLEVREHAFKQIRELLHTGHYILFFPEGVVTYDGKLTPFQIGLERIKRENPDCFIVPITITGLIGGYFSRVGGLFERTKLKKEFGRKVELHIGPSIPATRWNLSHFETKVKLMLHGEKAEVIDSTAPLELPAVRVAKRTKLRARRRKGTLEVVGQGQGCRLVFLDASTGGFCVQVAKAIEIDTIVKISMENLNISLDCQVRWCVQIAAQRYKVGLKIIKDSPSNMFMDLKDAS